MVSLLHARPATSAEEPKESDLGSLSIEELMNVVVESPTKTRQPLQRAPATIVVITSDQIRERGYDHLDDALRDLPGIDFVRVQGAFPTIFAFRGTYGDENKRLLVLVDGHVDNSLNGGLDELGGPAYSLHHVERIEVIWGPASALYGANAYSGVVNLIIKQGAGHEGFAYQKGFGSFDTQVDKFSLVATEGKVALSLGGSLFSTDGPVFTRKHPFFADAYVDQAYSLIGRLSYATQGSKTTLGGHAFDTPMGDGTFGNTPTAALGLPPGHGYEDGSTTGYLPFPVGFPADDGRPSRWHPYRRTAFLTHEQELSEDLRLTGTLTYRETGLAEDSYSYFLQTDGLVSRNRLTHHSSRVGADVLAAYGISDSQSLVAGLQYYRDDLESGFRARDPDPRVEIFGGLPFTNLHALFRERVSTIQHSVGGLAQYVLDVDLLRFTSVTLGARYDHNSRYGSTFNPRVGVVVGLTKRLTAKLLCGTAFRAPTSFELYASAPVRVANPDLGPEKVWVGEAGASYSLGPFLLQGTFFHHELSDIISFVPVEPGKSQLQNVGTARTMGLELTALFRRGDWEAYANFTLQDGDQDDGTGLRPIPNIARVKGNFGFTYRLGDVLTASWMANWVDERSVAATNPRGAVDGYFVTHATLTSAPFFEGRFRVHLIANNLLDATYFDPGIRAADGVAFDTVHDQPGFRALLKVSAEID